MSALPEFGSQKSVIASMSSFISAFDEAPKTPTRSYTTSRQKVIVESPENTPPSSPISKPARKSITTRVPLSAISTTQSLDKALQEAAVSDKLRALLPESSNGAAQTASSSSMATDTQSLGDAFELEDGASQISNWRFEQMELEVASLRDELKSFQSNKLLDVSDAGSEPVPLLLESSGEKEKLDRFEQTIELLQSRIDQLEASQTQAIEVAEPLSPIVKVEPTEMDLLKSISERRMESLVSSFLPFMSESKTLQIAKWLNETMGFSARNTMRRIWSLILLIDLSCIFVQARFPHIWGKMSFKQIPRGWYKRLSTMRYCLEMLLIVQFGIAAQQVATHQSTISLVKSTASSIYEAIRTLFVKYLPTGLVIACTASFATWIYRNRLAQNMLH